MTRCLTYGVTSRILSHVLHVKSCLTHDSLRQPCNLLSESWPTCEWGMLLLRMTRVTHINNTNTHTISLAQTHTHTYTHTRTHTHTHMHTHTRKHHVPVAEHATKSHNLPRVSTYKCVFLKRMYWHPNVFTSMSPTTSVLTTNIFS